MVENMIEYAKRIAYSSVETLLFTYEMSVKYKDYFGSYCEMGVAAGAQIIAMRAGAPNKRIHAFDSFQGIPRPSNRDDQMPGIKFLSKEEQAALPAPGKQELKTTGATAVPIESFLDHLVNSGAGTDNVVIHQGWFEDTVKSFDEPIAILRLDGDLYNSTYVCLKHLYPIVESGGIIIIDDWQLPGCKLAVMDYISDTKRIYSGKSPVIQFVSNIAYFIKP